MHGKNSKWSPRFALLTSFALAASAGVAGCHDAVAPIGPPNAAEGPVANVTVVGAEAALQAPVDFSDIVERMAPRLGDDVAADRLRTDLDEYTRAVEAGDVTLARRSLAAARKVLASSDAHPANLAAAGLALTLADARLAGRPEEQ